MGKNSNRPAIPAQIERVKASIKSALARERRDRFSLRECGDAILSRCSRRRIVNLIYRNNAESLLLAFFLFRKGGSVKILRFSLKSEYFTKLFSYLCSVILKTE